MSIFNEELLAKFESIVKKSQDSSTYVEPFRRGIPDPVNPVSLAKRLVKNLDKQLNYNVSVTSDNTTTTPLSTTNIKSFDSIIQYLHSNKILVDGQRIVYDLNEFNNLQESVKKTLVVYDTNMSRNNDDLTSRKFTTQDFFIDQKLLIKYVQYLQQKATNENDRIFAIMVRKIVDNMNKLYNLNLSSQSKPEPGKTVNAIPPNTDLDYLSSKIFDAKKIPGYSTGSGIALKAKDIENKGNFNSWLFAEPKAEVITYQKNEKGQEEFFRKPFDDDESDICAIFRNLYYRAKHLKQFAKNPEEEKNATYYITKIVEISRSFDYNGKSCSSFLETSGEISQKPSNQNGGKGDSGTGVGDSAQEVSRAINALFSEGNLPLSLSDVSFSRIERFYAKANALFENTNLSDNIKSQYALFRDDSNAVKRTTRQGVTGTEFTLSEDPVIFGNQNVGQPVAKNYLPTVQGLRACVNSVIDTLQVIKNAYGSRLSDQQKNLVNNQLYVGQRNNATFNSLESQVNRFTTTGIK